MKEAQLSPAPNLMQKNKMVKNLKINTDDNTEPQREVRIEVCVPQYLTFHRGRLPKYSVFAEMLQEHKVYPFGSMARSGILIRSVLKLNTDFSPFITLGAFSSCQIPKNSLVTFYGGEKKHITDIVIKTHAIRLPGTSYVEDGKGLSLLFQRPCRSDMISLPTEHPNLYMLGYQSAGIGFMLNHAKKKDSNCVLKYVFPPNKLEEVGYHPVPVIMSKRNIETNEELLFDYNTFGSKSFL